MSRERLNYSVLLRCLDCGAEFEVHDSCVNPSSDVIVNSHGQRVRVAAVTFLNECRVCKNLRLVGSGT